jgi:hypothetical protein
MRRFWGHNDLSSAPRFSRDDDQILALNYENLCDGDYLQKLFVTDPFNTKDNNLTTLFIGESNRSIASSSESALLNPEMAEDVILFGDSIPLGKHFHMKRLQRELQQSNKFYDSVSLQISRQVLVYEHIAQLMSTRCNAVLPNMGTMSAETKAISAVQFAKSLIFSALSCSLRMVRSVGDWKLVTSQNIKAVLSVLSHFLKAGQYASRWFEGSGNEIFCEVCSVFMHSVKSVLSANFLAMHRWDRSSFEEEIRLPLNGIFGLLAVGIITHDSDNMIVATNFLSVLVMMVEDRSESFIKRLKEELSFVPSSTGNTNMNVKNVPAKVSAKIKQQQQSMAKATPSKLPQKDRPTTSDVIEDSAPKLTYSGTDNRDAFPEPSIPIVSDSSGKLQSHGSGAKVWDKSIGAKVALEKEKEANKKPTKAMKQADPPKMLHEYLDSKESMMLPTTNLVVNYAMTDAGVPAKSNQGSNNENKVVREKLSSQQHELPTLTEVKRIEKDLKDAMHAVLLLPKSVVDMLRSYSSSLEASTPVVTSPGKKSTPVKNKEHVVSSTFSYQVASKVYSCGQNSYGELGLGDVSMRKTFTRISTLDEKGIISIGAGNEHSLFVTKEGKLMTAGYNDNGQCGVGTTQQVRQPTIVQALEDEEICYVHVYNGCEHTIALTKEGKVYSFGYNYRGQVSLCKCIAIILRPSLILFL